MKRDRGLPTELLITDGDNRLYVDTTSPALTSAAAKAMRGRSGAVIEEVLDTGVAVGPQGRFTHELIVPFIRRGGPAAVPQAVRAPAVRRTFAPGGEWMYVKVHTGTASADRVLTDAIGPVVTALKDAGMIDHWFFLRYADPGHHLRIRISGKPDILRERVFPALTEALEPHLADGTVYNVALDTYHREIERYGGDAGIELAERIHAADSDAVLAVLGMLDGDDGARWKLCMYATDRLLADAGLDVEQRRQWARDGFAGYRPEYPNAANLESGIGAHWRVERADLTALLDDTVEHPYEPARQAFRDRSVVIAPILAELREHADELTVPVGALLQSLAHLHAVRLLRSAARTHELVLLGFLDRYYASQIARTSGKTRSDSPKKSVVFR